MNIVGSETSLASLRMGRSVDTMAHATHVAIRYIGSWPASIPGAMPRNENTEMKRNDAGQHTSIVQATRLSLASCSAVSIPAHPALSR